MIPDFKTYIKESIWADLQDRSSGDVVRKEDEIPPHLKDCLLKYIEMCIESNEYCAADLTEFTMYIEDYAYHPDIKKFDVDCDELIEYVEAHWKDVVHPLIQKMILNESVWADLQDRSSGDVTRKEDDVNLMDFEDFYQYLQTKYEANDEKCPIAGRLQLQNMDIAEVFTPIEKIGNFYKSLVFEYNKKNHKYIRIRSPKSLYERYPNLERFLSTKYTLEDIGKSILIHPKNGNITNQTIIDLVNIFLVNADNPLLKKIS